MIQIKRNHQQQEGRPNQGRPSPTPDSNLVKADASGKASNEGEKPEHGDKKKLEAVAIKAEGKFLDLDIVTDGALIGLRLGGSSQESGKGGPLLALKFSQTILVNKYLVLCQTGLGGFLVVKRWRRGGVDGGVDEDGSVLLVASSRDASKLEVLGRGGEGRVSLARWRGSL